MGKFLETSCNAISANDEAVQVLGELRGRGAHHIAVRIMQGWERLQFAVYLVHMANQVGVHAGLEIV